MANASEAVPNFLTTVDCWERFRFPNLPMHGLAHGVIPDVMEIVHSVFKKYGKLATFIKFANARLTDVALLGDQLTSGSGGSRGGQRFRGGSGGAS